VSVTEPLAAPRASNARVVATTIVVVAFIAGVLVGAVADRMFLFRFRGPERHNGFAANRITDRLARELSLTADQKQKVAAIVASHGKRMEAMWSGVRPQVRQEIDAANREISTVLTPDQRARFEKLRMRLGPRRGGPPPEP
jgi:Spy/CpxP family protein refolding chaperone